MNHVQKKKIKTFRLRLQGEISKENRIEDKRVYFPFLYVFVNKK